MAYGYQVEFKSTCTGADKFARMMQELSKPPFSYADRPEAIPASVRSDNKIGNVSYEGKLVLSYNWSKGRYFSFEEAQNHGFANLQLEPVFTALLRAAKAIGLEVDFDGSKFPSGCYWGK